MNGFVLGIEFIFYCLTSMLCDLCVGMCLYMSMSTCLCIQYLQEEKVLLVFPASTLIVYAS